MNDQNLNLVLNYVVFLVYGIEHKGYRHWDPISKGLCISRLVASWEHKMFSTLFDFQLFENNSPFFTNLSIEQDKSQNT